MRSLDVLEPRVKAAAGRWLERCKEAGHLVLVTDTLRTIQEQNGLYEQGRTKPGPIVTWARGGESYHNFGLALDFAILKSPAEACWDPKVDVDKDSIPDYQEAAELAKEEGFEWGGDWPEKKKDYPHLQMTFGLSTEDLREGKRPE